MNYWKKFKRVLLVCTTISTPFICTFGQQSSSKNTYDYRMEEIIPSRGLVKIGNRVLYKNSQWNNSDGQLHIADGVVINVYIEDRKANLYMDNAGLLKLTNRTTDSYVQYIYHATKGSDADLGDFISRNQFYMINDTLYIPTTQLVDENHGFFFGDETSKKYFAASKYPKENQIFITKADMIEAEIFKSNQSEYRLHIIYADNVKKKQQPIGYIDFEFITNEL